MIQRESESTEDICPVCGCEIESESYELDGVTYCCEPCATGGPCECGCIELEERNEES